MLDVDQFINRWSAREGGQERANYALFLSELCSVIGVPAPEPAGHEAGLNAYVFERAVTFRQPDGTTARGRIDLYKRGSFVLEAKQSRQGKGGKLGDLEQQALLPPHAAAKPKRDVRGWDVLMLNARRQAEDYAKALPSSEGWPPFLIVCDVGHCLELFADFSGQGKNYAQFPDRQGFRIFMDDLRNPDVRERLRLIWTSPHELDPTKKAAKVTRDIAVRLAKVSVFLESRRATDGRPQHAPEQIALFLMRCLFTMFAEDVELLPKDSFRNVLARCRDNPALFPRLVGQLWEAMDTGEFAFALEQKVRRFNGYLFKDRTVLPLPADEIGELYQAALANWREVEPAIFGTLLEQALDPVERRRLGAHYTPRAYVERLVVAALIEPLRAEWDHVQATAERLNSAGSGKAALAEVEKFYGRLCETKVLDPACGTGNFLYVAMEMMKRLEGEVLEAVADLGGQEALTFEGHTVDPHQFLGIEVNPRAAAIAELVVWIGFLQWHFRTKGSAPAEPVLKDFRTIKAMDAVLAHDPRTLRLDQTGQPETRMDADGQRVEVYDYRNPKRPVWPDVDYIVGNPPFIGGKDIRGRFGEGYAKALWAAHPHMNESADFVMYWWDRAAELLTRKGSRLKRFGFVTTNSITQEFSRRVMAARMKAKKPVSLVMAIPDHPWTKQTKDAAAVRIAMTVVVAGTHEGVLSEVVSERHLESDTPELELVVRRGTINADLTVGADVTAAVALKANDFVCSPGVKLHGAGFIVTRREAEALGLGRRQGLDRHIREYRNGRDLAASPRDVLVIDLFGLSADTVRRDFPEVYQHVVQTVKESKDEKGRPNGRDANNRDTYRLNWWIFGEPRPDLRSALSGLSRYIATVETSKHRVFQFLDASILPDNRLICMALDSSFHLGVLSSRIHVCWSLATGGTLEDRPVYTKTACFDRFPFPDEAGVHATKISAVADELDAFRKDRQAECPGLTITQIYNVLEKLRSPDALTDDDERVRSDGLVLILKELHDRLDGLVCDAYGWPHDLSDEEVVARLVALNKERAKAEARHVIHWLRPDYQMVKAGMGEQAPRAAGKQVELGLVAEAARAQKPGFPDDEVARTAAIMAALAGLAAPADAAMIASGFRQGRRVEPQVQQTLLSLFRMGYAASGDGVNYLLRRAA